MSLWLFTYHDKKFKFESAASVDAVYNRKLCICSSDKITVQINRLGCLGKHPIAHTCDCIIELPTAYSNYDDIYNDFHCIFA